MFFCAAILVNFLNLCYTLYINEVARQVSPICIFLDKELPGARLFVVRKRMFLRLKLPSNSSGLILIFSRFNKVLLRSVGVG